MKQVKALEALIQNSLPTAQVVDLLNAQTHLRLVRNPSLLGKMITDPNRTVVIDEVQKLPAILDEVQRLRARGGSRFDGNDFSGGRGSLRRSAIASTPSEACRRPCLPASHGSACCSTSSATASRWKRLESCDEEPCPYAIDGVNHAPFAALEAVLDGAEIVSRSSTWT